MDEDKQLIGSAVRRPYKKSPYDSKKFMRLKCLNCFPEVHDLLSKGLQASKVAALVQNQHGEYTDIQHTTLTDMLRDYYANEIPDAEKVANQLPEKFNETIRSLEESVNVLEEYTSLFRIQRKRIDVLLEKEEASETLMKTTGREIKTAAELLDRIKRVQDSTGLTPGNTAALHQNAAMALGAELATGASGRFLMSAQKRNTILDFMGMLESADPRVIEAVIVSGPSAELPVSEPAEEEE